MFVYINVGGNQPGWVVALTFLLPLLLQSGLLGELAAWVLQLMSPVSALYHLNTQP